MDASMVNAGMKLVENNHLSIARASLAPNDAILLPKAFMLDSILPEFKDTKVHYYAAPCMGAKFLECKLLIEKDGGSKEAIVNGYENFMYVISGEVEVLISGKKHTLEAEGYFWLPPMVDFEICNKKDEIANVLWVRKRYEETKFYSVPDPIVSSVLDIPPVQNIAEIEQQCLPFEKNFGFDMAMNMLTFAPGVTFPFVSNGGTAMIASWGLLAYLKATDTRQNASFAIRLPSRREDRGGARLAPRKTEEWEAPDEED